MTLREDINKGAFVHRIAEAVLRERDPNSEKAFEFGNMIAGAYKLADEKGMIYEEEGLNGMLAGEEGEKFLQTVSTSSIEELKIHAQGLKVGSEKYLVERVRDNYKDVLESIPAKDEETGGLERVLLSIDPQGLNEKGEDTINDEYGEVAEQHGKYLVANNAARIAEVKPEEREAIMPFISSLLPYTARAFLSLYTRYPLGVAPLAKSYAKKQAEKYLNMFKSGNGENAPYTESSMRDYITRNENLADDENKILYLKEIGLGVPRPREGEELAEAA